ncbi:hypothetical protein BOX15_Mlig021585g1 [Macrostomum lignano]|uniref:Phosphorylase b kinase regulatory subunit n=3 Tax=Macrostomum lignano TaxID=282301 RepID=A0A1I8H1K2_9PLAT|nr:hypothetical protein BOX15_Mlig021585g1 [Macrostomum lignano]
MASAVIAAAAAAVAGGPPAPASNANTSVDDAVFAILSNDLPKYDDAALEGFYRQCADHILAYQHPISGLFPLYPGSGGPAGHARDNIYIATSIWALAQVYRKTDRDSGRCWELRQRALKCMRSLLAFWMSQTDRLEAFKVQQCPKNCLLTLFDYRTGRELTDSAFSTYQHHQLDCIALFVLMSVQMISSGMEIVHTKTEVSVFQNLIFYLERAYRIPDFGMWERGTKQNTGSVELHASSVGFAKAALEAANSFNVFGQSGDHTTVIHVDIDAHSRNRIILTNLLPRESASKGCDSALIPTLCWPGHATHEPVRKTALHNIFSRFRGEYGFKRFSRDGYGTVLEPSRGALYSHGELKSFEAIECQWPIMYAFLVIEHCLQGDRTTATLYKQKLDDLRVECDLPFGPDSSQPPQSSRWLPKFYFVPRDYLQEERDRPGSQARRPNFELNDTVFLWGEAVALIAELLESGYLMAHDLDLLRRYKSFHERPLDLSRRVPFINKLQDLVVQVVLISESVRLQQMLATFGVQSQTPTQVEPITLWPSKNLIKVQECLGQCERLGLSGRPLRPIGQLGTAKFYRVPGRTVLCYPLLFEMRDFYLLHDMDMVIDEVRTNLQFLSTWWRLRGRPTFCFLLREDMIRAAGAKQLIAFLTGMRSGRVNGVRVLLGRAQNLLASACVDHLDYLQDHGDAFKDLPSVEELSVEKSFRSLMNIQGHAAVAVEREEWIDVRRVESSSSEDLCQLIDTASLNMGPRTQLLHILHDRHGPLYALSGGTETVSHRLEDLSRTAGVQQRWAIVRYASAILRKEVDSLAPSLSNVIVAGKKIIIGSDIVIDRPLTPKELCQIMYAQYPPGPSGKAVLLQELILFLGSLISRDNSLFRGIYYIRLDPLVDALDIELENVDDALYGGCKILQNLSPYKIQSLLVSILRRDRLRDPYWQRRIDGCLCRVPPGFYEGVYGVLEACTGGVRIGSTLIEQYPCLNDMSRNDANFVFAVQAILARETRNPALRQMLVEALVIIELILQRNPELAVKEELDVLRIIDEAWRDFKSERELTGPEADKSMVLFYQTEAVVSRGTSSFIAKAALNFLLKGELSLSRSKQLNSTCLMS